MTTTDVSTTARGLAAPPVLDDPPVGLVMDLLAPIEVPSSTEVGTALHRLRELGREHVVTRAHGQVRAASEADLLHHLLDGGHRAARMSDPVSAVATPAPTVAPTTRRSWAAELMLAGGATLLVVADDDGPCGVLDAGTLLHSVARGWPRSA
ncbi:CBS domain-containing protein [Actinomycetospora cinnamomea]|uniref:CBS domain-containing protein n=1 Tax=Actinomycetospora cinnamomea TaxID=663609 RepID=A0A2U1F3T4_9PSEU|nr:CBS domain-containing protein [Actinomycetospora cinnamomea]PVZ06809.1 hypothetical protein C8D89_1122 [Actinomycetospora cinnamomea]